MKILSDFIHLYIGCELRAPHPQDLGITKGYLTGIHGEYGPEVQFIVDGNAEEEPDYPGIENIQLVLRRLSSMTEEELKGWVNQPNFSEHQCKKKLLEISSSIYGLYGFISFYGSAGSIPWLLKNGFDLFNLIDDKLAIDAATLNLESKEN